jgi:hypothetical protein
MSDIEMILLKTFDLVKAYYRDHIGNDGPVVEYKDPQKLTDLLQLEINTEGVGYEELFGEIGKYLKFCVHTF